MKNMKVKMNMCNNKIFIAHLPTFKWAQCAQQAPKQSEINKQGNIQTQNKSHRAQNWSANRHGGKNTT